MSKICNLCGSILNDETVFCPFCGMRLKPEKSPDFSPPVLETPKIPEVREPPAAEMEDKRISDAPTAKPKKRISKKWLAIGGGVLGLLVILVACAFLFRPDPGIAVEKYEAFINGDYTSIEEMAPMEYWEYLARINRMTTEEYLADREKEADRITATARQKWEEIYGYDVVVCLDIVDRIRLSDDDTKDLADNLEDNFDIDADAVKAAYDLIIRVNYQGFANSDILAGYAIAVQIDSEWYLLRYSKTNLEGPASFLILCHPSALLYY